MFLFLRPLLGLLLLLNTAPGVVDAGSAEACFASATNATRSSHGLSLLPVSGQISSEARNHSQAMASQSSLYHSQPLTQYSGNWVGLGENVGSGPTCDAIQQAFLNSPHHYENIVDPSWTTFGVGVVVAGDGTIWVTVAFETIPGAAPKPAVAPAPAPAPAPVQPAPSQAAPAPAPTHVAPAPTHVAPTPTHAPTPAASTPAASTPAPTPAETATPTETATPPGTVIPTGTVSPTATATVLRLRAAEPPVTTDQSTNLASVAVGLGGAPVLCLIVYAAWTRRERGRRRARSRP